MPSINANIQYESTEQESAANPITYFVSHLAVDCITRFISNLLQE